MIISTLRKRKGLKQEELADMLGLTRSTIGKWEAGENNPKVKDIPHIAQALGVGIEELFQEETVDEGKRGETRGNEENEGCGETRKMRGNEGNEGRRGETRGTKGMIDTRRTRL